MTTLPNGWAEATLKDLGNSIKGSLQPRGDAMFELYSVPSFASAEPEVIQGSDIGSHKRPVIPGDLLICKINPRINRVWIVGARGEHDQIASPEWLVLRTPSPELVRLLRYQLSAPDFRRWIEKGVHGVTGSHTRAKEGHVLDFVVRVAPTAEQERIVAAIEEAFSKLDAGEAGLRTVRQLLKRMRDSILTAAVTGRLVPQDPTDTPASKLLTDLGIEPIEHTSEFLPALSDNWAATTIGAVSQMSLGKMLDAKAQTGQHPTPYLRNINVRWGYFDLGDLAVMDIRPDEFDRVAVAAGDLVVCEGGEPGRCAVWRQQPMATQKALHRVRPMLGVSADYLALVLAWWRSRSDYERFITGTTIKHIPKEKLRRLPVPLPPPEEQIRIVTEVDRQLSFLDACERAVDAGLARSAALRRSVLKTAFEGKLVPQDPTDEPASVLLDRIRGSRVVPGSRVTRRDRRHTPSVESEA